MPLLDGDSKIILTTPLASSPYIDITLQVLSSYGIKIQTTDYGFLVFGNQKYNGHLLPEGDWSNSAFFLVMGALLGDITVTGLNLDSVQGDRKIIEILKNAGAKVECSGDSVRVVKSDITPFSYDAGSCPDLVPITAVLASMAQGQSVINSVARLKIKESDRIDTTIKTLKSFGISATSDGITLTITGAKPTSATVNSFNDHRIVMSATVLCALAKGESTITDADAVNKSYPTFFEDFIMVGGIVNEF